MNAQHETLAHLRLLAGEQAAGRYLELRYAPPGRDWMRRITIPASQPQRAAHLITRLAPTRDVYIGAALRDSTEHGGANAIEISHLLWIETDDPGASARLRRFEPPPSLLVASSPGHLHAYWQLTQPVARDQLQAANRKLAHHLGGDPASIDLARLLRPCGSLNHKRTTPAPVRLLAHRPDARYELDTLTGGLADPAPRRRHAHPGPWRAVNPLDARLRSIPAPDYAQVLAGAQPNRAGKISCPFHDLSVGRAVSAGVSPACSPADASSTDRQGPPPSAGDAGPSRVSSPGSSPDPLRLVPPPVYFELLTGLRVGRSGKLRCMFHDDRSPSLHVYREPDRGWYCFGCGRGGSIYDLAGLLSGRGTRGSDFSELRRELERLVR